MIRVFRQYKGQFIMNCSYANNTTLHELSYCRFGRPRVGCVENRDVRVTFLLGKFMVPTATEQVGAPFLLKEQCCSTRNVRDFFSRGYVAGCSCRP
jgi:hypothetical protein